MRRIDLACRLTETVAELVSSRFAFKATGPAPQLQLLFSRSPGTLSPNGSRTQRAADGNAHSAGRRGGGARERVRGTRRIHDGDGCRSKREAHLVASRPLS